MKKTLKYFAWACVIAAFAAPVALADDDKAVNNDAAIARSLDIFNTLYKELNTFYVDTIDAQKSIENAINAMLDDIDPYTEYIPAKETDEFITISTGEYGGIGSYLMERTVNGKKGVYISGPYEGSPAARAGLRSGDRIIMIDGDSTANWTSDQVSKRLKGQANTHLTVTVVRPYDEDSIKTFSFNRETISVNPVPYYGVTRDNIGYIDLTSFNEKSAQQVRDALIELKKDPRVKNIVLDLRSNGGGIVEGAIQIVGYFVPKGTQVLVMRGRDKSSERTYKTTVDPIDTDIPLAVLIDGGSASASEITAGALQDLDRAVIIGSRSFGKGLVQSTRQLPYDGILKVTIAKYYIPSGRLIQEVDYGNRNDDGTYKKTTTDSTARIFHTAHGREVREGGGIMPDIKVEPRELKRIVYNIMRDHWDFDFATKYVAEHGNEIANPAGVRAAAGHPAQDRDCRGLHERFHPGPVRPPRADAQTRPRPRPGPAPPRHHLPHRSGDHGPPLLSARPSPERHQGRRLPRRRQEDVRHRRRIPAHPQHPRQEREIQQEEKVTANWLNSLLKKRDTSCVAPLFYKPVACNTGTAREGTRFYKKLFELFFFIEACLGNNE